MIVFGFVESTAAIEIYFTHVEKSRSISGGRLRESAAKVIHLCCEVSGDGDIAIYFRMIRAV